jgi:hypothetical protein
MASGPDIWRFGNMNTYASVKGYTTEGYNKETNFDLREFKGNVSICGYYTRTQKPMVKLDGIHVSTTEAVLTVGGETFYYPEYAQAYAAMRAFLRALELFTEKE